MTIPFCRPVRTASFPVLLKLVLLVTLSSHGFAQKHSASSIVAPDATLKEIFSAGETFLEGPAMSPDGMLFFSDLPLTNGIPGKAGIIWELNPQTEQSRVFRSPSGMANGLIFDANGDLIVCEGADFGGRRVTKTDMKTGKSVIVAGLYEGKPFNAPNDLTIDQQGRIYFTDPRYIGHESLDQHVMGVYRIDSDGSIHLLAANVNKPNGIGISPDQKTLYVANTDYPGNGTTRFLPNDFKGVKPTGAGSIIAYNVMADGSLELKGTFIDFKNEGPDGLTLDVEGNLYIAMGNKVGVYSPQGIKLTEIKTPQATNVCFGIGKFSNTLFIAGGKSIYAVETKKEGYHISKK